MHSCPFRRVSNGNFRSNGVYFVEDSQKLGFQFKRFETHCGVDMIYTTEGLYVAPLTVELKDLEKYEDFSDTRGTLDLVLADEDFKFIESLENEKYLLYKECVSFLMSLKIFALSENIFLRVTDYKNNDIIIYTTNGQIYVPNCIKIPSVNLITLDSCFEDIPLTFILNNKVEKGYLTSERVIKIFSRPVKCNGVPKYITLPYLNKTIVSLNQKLDLVDTINVKFKQFDFYDIKLDKNLSHLELVTKGLDLIGQFHNLTYNNVNGEEWLILPNDNNTSSTIGSNFLNFLSKTWDWIWFIVKFLFWLIVGIFVLFVFLKLGEFAYKLYKIKQSKDKNQVLPVSSDKNMIFKLPVVKFDVDENNGNTDIDFVENNNEQVDSPGTSKSFDNRGIYNNTTKRSSFSTKKRNILNSVLNLFPSKSMSSLNTLEQFSMNKLMNNFGNLEKTDHN